MSKGLKILIVFLLALSMIIPVYATDYTDAENALKNDVYGGVAGKSYAKEGGGSLSGDELFVSDGDSYNLDEDSFNQLTSSAQADLIRDIKREAEESAKTNEEVSRETIQNWFKELQTLDGVGSKLMTTILENTKPDFVTANIIYEPFSGLVGTVMGLLAILIMVGIGLVMALDIAYIALPTMRMLTNGDDKKGLKSNLISNDAIYAVRVAEDQNDGGGTKKQALGIYFKRRVVMLIVLGICLLYLVQGAIYDLVGFILDLVSGFLGF